MQEMLSDLAPLLGVVLTAIGAFFMYRKTEQRREIQLREDSKTATLVTAANAVAGLQNGRLYVEELQRLCTAIDRQTDSMALTAMTHKESAARAKDFLEEMEGTRRALQEIATILKRRDDDRGHRIN